MEQELSLLISIAGVVIIIFGLQQIGLFKLVSCWPQSRLTCAATMDTVGKGVMLLIVYSAGLGIPFLVTTVAMKGFFKLFSKIKQKKEWPWKSIPYRVRSEPLPDRCGLRWWLWPDLSQGQYLSGNGYDRFGTNVPIFWEVLQKKCRRHCLVSLYLFYFLFGRLLSWLLLLKA